MALYIPHSIFHLARLLCVRAETFGPYYVTGYGTVHTMSNSEYLLSNLKGWNNKIGETKKLI